MQRSDLKQVLEIERLSFRQPYSQEILAQELQIAAARVWVASYRHKIMAYIDFWLLQDELELVSIAVHPAYKRRGIGQRLLEKMMNFAQRHGVKAMYLDVRAGNASAQLLYGKLGFTRVGLRKRYYSDNGEDAIILRKELP